jgi:hypothetical protein
MESDFITELVKWKLSNVNRYNDYEAELCFNRTSGTVPLRVKKHILCLTSCWYAKDNPLHLTKGTTTIGDDYG